MRGRVTAALDGKMCGTNSFKGGTIQDFLLSLVYYSTGVTFHDSLLNTQLRSKVLLAYI